MTAILSLSTFNPYSVRAAPQHPPVQTWAAVALVLLLEQLSALYTAQVREESLGPFPGPGVGQTGAPASP